MNVLRVALGICIAALFGGSACTSDSDAVREACSGGNLLELHTAMDSYGVIREQRLTDGAVPSPAGPINDYVAAIFFGPGAHVTFDLGAPKRIAALQVVSDNDDSQLVSVSLDGAAFEPVPLSAAGGQGLRTRHARDLDIAARFVRLAPTSLERGRVVAEVAAFCSIPDPFPVTLVQRGNYQEDVDALLLRAKVIGLSKVLLVVAAIALILWLPLSNSRHRTLLAVGFVCVGFLGWLRFGDLVGGGGMVHAWDGMHYYLGSKYFDELRYAELYRCIALHERQRGRGFMVDRERVRDLDTNREYPGSWASTQAGACRAHFSPERWSEFGRDVDLLRRDFQYRHFHKALNDHGYNATPPHTTWVQVLSSAVAPTRSGLAWLALLDALAIIVAVGAMWWGFGPMPAAVAALTLGLGGPWSILWTGGSVARWAWVPLLVGGLALLRRERPFLGAMALTVAGLLRFFPLVFVGGLGLFALFAAWRSRRLGLQSRRALGGVAVSMLVGLGAGAAAYGPGVYGEFLANMQGHGALPPGNTIGLGSLVSAGLGESALHSLQNSAVRPGEVLRAATWLVGLFASLVLVVRQARRERPLWEAIPWSAPLLFCAIPLSGYDYAWIAVLAPVAASSRFQTVSLLAFVAFSGLLVNVVGHTPTVYAILSALFALSCALVLWRWRG